MLFLNDFEFLADTSIIMIYKVIISLFIFFSALSSHGSEKNLCAQIFKGPEYFYQIEKNSFLYNHLLKKEHLTEKAKGQIADDLSHDKLRKLSQHWKDKYILRDSDFKHRFKMIQDMKISNIVAAPGHRQLRNKAQVEGLTSYIRESNGGNFEHDKILLNIVTTPDNKIKGVDLWNAHHRLVAYLNAGYETVGQLNPRNLEILVNGRTIYGENWSHYLPIAGVDEAFLPNYQVVPAFGEIRLGTIGIDGSFSNYRLGSRNTLGQLRNNTNNSRNPKIGVYFGTFDPIHEGHIAVLKLALKEQNLDEIIIVPNINPIHKSGITSSSHRINMIARRIANEEGLNLYVGDSSHIIDQFGRNPFFERMTQTYGTYDLHQIIGSDSFLKLLENNELATSNFRKYIVFMRKGDSPIENVDPGKVTFSEYQDTKGTSSTMIRQMIKQGERPNPEALSDEVYDYIRQHSLYNLTNAP